MESISQVIDGPVSTYTGSPVTRSLISDQISARWGKSELKNYDPYHNARTFKSWLKLGFKVRKGEKALRSVTYVPVTDPVDGRVIKRIKRSVFLFYYKQVDKANV